MELDYGDVEDEDADVADHAGADVDGAAAADAKVAGDGEGVAGRTSRGGS